MYFWHEGLQLARWLPHDHPARLNMAFPMPPSRRYTFEFSIGAPSAVVSEGTAEGEVDHL